MGLWRPLPGKLPLAGVGCNLRNSWIKVDLTYNFTLKNSLVAEEDFLPEWVGGVLSACGIFGKYGLFLYSQSRRPRQSLSFADADISNVGGRSPHVLPAFLVFHRSIGTCQLCMWRPRLTRTAPRVCFWASKVSSWRRIVFEQPTRTAEWTVKTWLKFDLKGMLL